MWMMGLAMVLVCWGTDVAMAATAKEIDVSVDVALENFEKDMAGSFGLQFGAQAKTIVLVFLDEDALRQFRKSEGWKVGIDGSVAVIAIGAGTSLDSSKLNHPIVGFVLDQKGLMYNLTLEGSKFTRINK
jgi:lipid-binding SYLF domain-containing protein